MNDTGSQLTIWGDLKLPVAFDGQYLLIDACYIVVCLQTWWKMKGWVIQ